MKKLFDIIENSYLRKDSGYKKLSKIYSCYTNNKKILLIDFFDENEMQEENHYIYSVDLKDNKIDIIGNAIFELKKDKECTLWDISLVDYSCAGKGFGSLMLEYIEYVCFKKNINKIKGKYDPCGILEDRTKEFYKKHGFTITEVNNVQFIQKELNKECLSNNSYNTKHRSIRRK